MSSGNQRYIETAGSHFITMNDDFINVRTSVGAITLVFPNIRDSGAINTNKVWFVNDVDDLAATNNVTISASETTPATELNGGSSVVLDTNGFSAEIVPSGYYNYMVNSGISDGGMTGSGTLNYVAKFTPSGTVLGNSQLFDNGSSVGLGTILPSADTKFHIKGIDNTSNNFSLKIDGLASNTPLLYVRNDGFVGVGVALPAYKFHVQIASGEIGTLVSDNITNLVQAIIGSRALFGTTSAHDLQFVTTGSARMTIKSGGGINMSLQTGNAGLSSGDLYVDTAANILANGDLVVGRKV